MNPNIARILAAGILPWVLGGCAVGSWLGLVDEEKPAAKPANRQATEPQDDEAARAFWNTPPEDLDRRDPLTAGPEFWNTPPGAAPAAVDFEPNPAAEKFWNTPPTAGEPRPADPVTAGPEFWNAPPAEVSAAGESEAGESATGETAVTPPASSPAESPGEVSASEKKPGESAVEGPPAGEEKPSTEDAAELERFRREYAAMESAGKGAKVTSWRGTVQAVIPLSASKDSDVQLYLVPVATGGNADVARGYYVRCSPDQAAGITADSVIVLDGELLQQDGFGEPVILAHRVERE